ASKRTVGSLVSQHVFSERSSSMTAYITMADLRIVGASPERLTVELRGSEKPLNLSVRTSEGGVVIEIPWYAKDKLGSPGYEALKASARAHYSGAIGTRTETDPAFRRAADARNETSVRRSRDLV